MSLHDYLAVLFVVGCVAIVWWRCWQEINAERRAIRNAQRVIFEQELRRLDAQADVRLMKKLFSA